MISSLESRVLDANSESLGVPVSELMGNAGKAVADHLESQYPGKRFAFVCGTGNNGGDGFAAAIRMDPSRCKVLLLKKASQIRTDAARGFYSLLECPISPYSKDALEDCDVIVDCALGTGSSGTVRDPYRSFIQDANASGKPVVSVDIPSGLGSDICIGPVSTITFHDAKEGMDEASCGRIVVADIGIPEDASRIVGPGDMLRYPVPADGSHKGANGRLLAISGGPYFGAPALACRAALRTGADLVHLCCPASAFGIAASACPEMTGSVLPGDHLDSSSVDGLLELSQRYDAVLIGPGLGDSPDTMEAVRMFVSSCTRPMVIDADAIKALTDMSVPNAVITPHAGELRTIGTLDDAVGRFGAVLLKGREDTIADRDRTRINRTGNPGMTSGGTGDVLAGCVAALVSKGMPLFDAACLGAYIVGSAGDKAFASKSYGLMATDVAEGIPEVLREGLR